MSLDKTDLIEAVIISIGYVLLFMAIDFKVNGLLDKFTLMFIIGGVLLLGLRTVIVEKVGGGMLTEVIVQTIGLILLFLGFKTYAKQFVEQYWMIFIGIGIALYNYHKQVARLIAR